MTGTESQIGIETVRIKLDEKMIFRGIEGFGPGEIQAETGDAMTGLIVDRTIEMTMADVMIDSAPATKEGTRKIKLQPYHPPSSSSLSTIAWVPRLKYHVYRMTL
jgi:hypothetical protein